MGYSTYFDGALEIKPPLRSDDLADLAHLHDGVGGADWPPPWWTMKEEIVLATETEPRPYRCDWSASEDGASLECEDDRTYRYDEQLEHLIDDFFKPRGYVLSGRVDWSGEEDDDLGAMFVRDNVVKAVQAEIVIRDPFADLEED